jgi:proline dehydrogenase
MALNLVTKTSYTVALRPRTGAKKFFLLRLYSNGVNVAEQFEPAVPRQLSAHTPKATPLARLPTSDILRSLLLGSFFSSPLLFRFGFPILQKIATSRSALLNPDRNPLLSAIVKPLIYDQFCAGTNKQEINDTIARIKSIGFAGVILCSGKEIELRDPAKSQLLQSNNLGTNFDAEIDLWRQKNIETLGMVGSGDFLGIK